MSIWRYPLTDEQREHIRRLALSWPTARELLEDAYLDESPRYGCQAAWKPRREVVYFSARHNRFFVSSTGEDLSFDEYIERCLSGQG